jgi:hypothetical protein
VAAYGTAGLKLNKGYIIRQSDDVISSAAGNRKGIFTPLALLAGVTYLVRWRAFV